MIGKTISHYKVLEKLGGGGMGIVYKAEDTKLERTVALKFLPPEWTRDENAKARFLHEAKTASKLDHTNICTIHEIGETEDGQLYIAMALYEGETLQDKIEHGPLKIEEAIDIARQIAQGLAKAHENEMVHRDIKPANVIITKDGLVKILDFGLAKLAGQTMLTKEGTTLGTVTYMSPEQGQGEETDPRTDIWSLGVVFYEMITGIQPFQGDYEQAVIYSIMNEDQEPLTGLRTGIPMELERIVNKCLVKIPSERYQNVQDILVDLNALKKQNQSAASKSVIFEEEKPGNKSKSTFYSSLVLATLLLLVVLYFWKSSESPQIENGKVGLAVLPFDNVSPDPDDEYFADGMTDELISKLARISSFKIIARTSVMQYKNQSKSIAEISAELSVDKLIEGSVRKAGDRIKINVQLIDVNSQTLIWSDEYNRQLSDIFSIQDEISLAIIENLQIELLGEERAALDKHHTGNLDAYGLYLKGRFHWNKRSYEDIMTSIDYFNQAIQQDSMFALAHAGLADAYIMLGFWGYRSPKESYPLAKKAALQALYIDQSLADALTSLAFILTSYDWDWPAAESTFKKALNLSPGNAITHQWYSEYLMIIGRVEEGMEEIEMAQSLDPLSLIITSVRGEWFRYIGDTSRAIKQYEQALSLDPNFGISYYHRSNFYLNHKLYDKAIVDARKSVELLGDLPIPLANLASILAFSGDRGEAIKILNQLHNRAKDGYVTPMSFASIYFSLSDYEKAFEYLENAYQERDSILPFIIRAYHMMGEMHPYTEVVSDPRFANMKEKLRLK